MKIPMVIKQALLFFVLIVTVLSNACASKNVDGFTPLQDDQKEDDFFTGKIHRIKNAAELSSLSLAAGDKVIMLNGDWLDQTVVFKGKGTEQHPITLIAEEKGKVVLSGNSNLLIDGEWLVVDGLSFKDGYPSKGDVVVFSKTSTKCRLTNTSIVDYNPPATEADYKWVSLHGTHNRVDHCELTGKTHSGTTLVVWLADQPNHHQIDHNYFGPRPALGANGGETIRIGTSQWSMHDSHTVVSSNIFDKCDGEIEIISVKSGYNVIENNLFYECDGTLTLRHGNNTTVRDNYFVGNKKANTGGIRVIGESHVIHGNYLHGLAGRNLRAAISVMNAVENPELHEYYQVKDVTIQGNIIVDCREALVLGSGKNSTRSVIPDKLDVSYNYIINPTTLMLEMDKPTNTVIQKNQVEGVTPTMGFVKMGDDLIKKDGVWQLKTKVRTPFWRNDVIGPDWKNDKPAINVL